jgi:peptidoglycan-N-acetylglucosamine deacetylase
MAKTVRLGALTALGLLTVILVIPHLLPRLLSWHRADIVFRGDNSTRILYLTIDDSPSDATDEILDVLAKHKVTAAFFVMSGRVRSEGDLTKIVRAGHRLGHHMRSSQPNSKMDWSTFEADFNSTNTMLRKVSDVALFRPPSDFGTPRQISYAKEKGYTSVVGTVFPLDHWLTQTWAHVFLVRWLAIPGGIVILHDGKERGSHTAITLDRLIPTLRRRGYSIEDPIALAPPAVATASSNP